MELDNAHPLLAAQFQLLGEWAVLSRQQAQLLQLGRRFDRLTSWVLRLLPPLEAQPYHPTAAQAESSQRIEVLMDMWVPIAHLASLYAMKTMQEASYGYDTFPGSRTISLAKQRGPGGQLPIEVEFRLLWLKLN